MKTNVHRSSLARKNTVADDPITVIGAGPSGLASAIVLARAGRKVIVFEREKTIGARFHSDFQGLENWSAKKNVLDELHDLGMPVDFIDNAVCKGIALDWSGRTYAVSDHEPLFYLVRRGPGEDTLDHGLLQAARDAGAEVRFGESVDHAPPNSIIASGPRRADVIASGYNFRTSMDDGAWVCFDDRLAPWGYAYLLVAQGRGTLAACLFRDFKRHQVCLKAAVAFFTDHAGLEMSEPKPFGGYGMVSRISRAERRNGLLVGERAGLQDALAGFGLRYAMISGALAARSLLGGGAYEQALNKRLGGVHRASISNRWFFQLIGDQGRTAALRRISNGRARGALRHIYAGSLVHSLLFPVASWRFRERLKHPGCDHFDCDCAWCRAGHGESAKISHRNEGRRPSQRICH